MEAFLNILTIAGLGFLGILLYAFSVVWKKIKQNGFSPKKFFNENKTFWLVCIAFNVVLAIVIAVVPNFDEVLRTLGFAIYDDNYGGYVLLGIALAMGSDNTKMSGDKKLATTNPTKEGGGKT
jgi:hypothetical protein